MFAGLCSRLMMSYSALLLICLSFVTITSALLFCVRVSVAQLAQAQLAEAAVPAISQIPDQDQTRESIVDALGGLSESLNYDQSPCAYLRPRQTANDK
jgi:hypothetical protein